MEENLRWLRRKQKVLVSLVHVSQFTVVVAIGANNSYVPYPNLRMPLVTPTCNVLT